MSFFEQIQTDMYSAMKSNKKATVATLRTILSVLKSKQIDKQNKLTEEEELKIIMTCAKQRKESMSIFEKGGRNDLAQKEQNELSIIENYLPKMFDEQSIRKLIKKIISDAGATGMSDMGKVMPLIMKSGGGLIDGKLAQSIAKELLASSHDIS
jgi:hypothetical protein